MSEKVPVTSAKNHPLYAAKLAESTRYAELSDLQVEAMAIKSTASVVRALAIPYAGDLYTINGNSYVPWNITAGIMDEVYGPFGWSIHEFYTKEWNHGAARLFETSIRVTVKCRNSDGTILEKSIDKSGVSEVGSYKMAMDTAIKSSRSDAFSVATKPLGPALALFLYEKDTYNTDSPTAQKVYTPAPQQQRTTGSPILPFPPQPVTSQAYQGAGDASDGQKGMLLKFKYPASFVEVISRRDVTPAVDAITKSKVSAEDFMASVGFVPPASVTTEEAPY